MEHNPIKTIKEALRILRTPGVVVMAYVTALDSYVKIPKDEVIKQLMASKREGETLTCNTYPWGRGHDDYITYRADGIVFVG